MARRLKEAKEGRHIGTLPEDCLSHVLSFTTPRDSCRSALVSAAFLSAARTDAPWERFLPSDYPSILSRAVDPVEYSSKRELYFRLCDSILVDGGNMSFALERSIGRKCYMISPRSMSISWGNDQRYWSWITMAESRFPEVAELLRVCWLDISGRIDCRLLSPRTRYAAYLVFKFSPAGSSGFRDPPQLASVKLGAYTSELPICLEGDDGWLRDDGWLEAKLGEFYNDDGGDGDVKMSLREVEALHWKTGLIIQGLEVRPRI